MKKLMTLLLGIALGLWVSGCSDGTSTDGPGGGGGGEAGPADSGDGDTSDLPDAADGPWECLEGNVARWKEDGYTEGCGLYRCKPGSGCRYPAGCESDEDCLSSTKEAGWEVDTPVHCDITHSCAYGPVPGGG